MNTNGVERSTRREAIKQLGVTAGAGWILSSPTLANWIGNQSIDKRWKLGVIADLHGGLAPDARQRLDVFLEAMSTAQCDALVQLGDFAFPNAQHQEYADAFNAAHGFPIHVIGNHEFDYGLDRQACFRAWGIDAPYYRRDQNGLTILVLDGNDQGSPVHRGGYPTYIGPEQRRWLERELSQAAEPVLILSHQPLAGRAAVDNTDELTEMLGHFRTKILLCVNGHTHVDALVEVAGVPYLHVNSASYYWVGGETRMAAYTRPLFTTLTIEATSGTIEVAAARSEWAARSPEELGYFERENPPSRDMVTPQIRQRRIARQS